ncbi:hypothetical protein FKW77_010869 [Venturia effusa]|uniref:Hydrophobin n=1 Tax=Venturia effusa TaxID=50376 RepID=A0A517KYP1_9PEZI|nr:hypothetical protein FKW77_010869 [Venturia effusa]
MKLSAVLAATLFCLLGTAAADDEVPFSDVERTFCQETMKGRISCCEHSSDNEVVDSDSCLPIVDFRVTSKNFHRNQQHLRGQLCPKQKYDHGPYCCFPVGEDNKDTKCIERKRLGGSK